MESLIEIDRLTGSAYLLRDLIQERLGLSLNDERVIKLIINKLAGRMKQRRCQSCLEYYHLLMSDSPVAKNEWHYVMEMLAKSKTSFWRQTNPIRTLIDVVLPQMLSIPRTEPLRIWSASCSTGEEPLAIAMALSEAGWFERAPFEIHASDNNYAAIESAIQGIYSEEKIRHLDVNLRDKYFLREQDEWHVQPELHKRIKWKVANLMIQNEVAELAQSQIIFCRNVFIYFTGHAICKTLRLFARFMPAGACLFSDSGEYFTRLISSSKLFEPLSIGGSSIWVRRNNNAE